MDHDLADAVERELVQLSLRLTKPVERECLRCYLLRMMDQFGCEGTHRWTIHWRDRRAPKSRGLLRRRGRPGGRCRDREVVRHVGPGCPETWQLLPCAGVVRP